MAEILSVTELNEYVKYLLESNALLANLFVRGEISNFKRHSSGHCYFSLKDEGGTVRAVMFHSYAARLRFSPETGMKVILHGRVSSFVRNGDYQIYVDDMQPDGVGAMALAFEQLKKKLTLEGLFDEARKRPIPKFPQHIGIVTSPTGAAIRDLLQILSRRYPGVRVTLFSALVQGPMAPASLMQGLSVFATEMPVDLIIIGRGGGSMEDLWCFNDEALVRAVAASPIPVISAVGHEVDFTLCDFAADLRAPTPSAAAELAVPDRNELFCRIEELEKRLMLLLKGRLDRAKQAVGYCGELLDAHAPSAILNESRMQVLLCEKRLEHACKSVMQRQSAGFSAICQKLHALDPMRVLARGYGIVFDDSGKALCSVKDMKEEEEIRLRLYDGEAVAVVKNVREVCYGREEAEL